MLCTDMLETLNETLSNLGIQDCKVENMQAAIDQLRTALKDFGWSQKDADQYIDDCDICETDGFVYSELLDIQWVWPVSCNTKTQAVTS